jgi:hypothetical protein
VSMSELMRVEKSQLQDVTASVAKHSSYHQRLDGRMDGMHKQMKHLDALLRSQWSS